MSHSCANKVTSCVRERPIMARREGREGGEGEGAGWGWGGDGREDEGGGGGA